MLQSGIYITEILENVPIDKYFELFKPSSGSEGGTIHIRVDFEAVDSAQANGQGEPCSCNKIPWQAKVVMLALDFVVSNGQCVQAHCAALCREWKT